MQLIIIYVNNVDSKIEILKEVQGFYILGYQISWDSDVVRGGC